MEKTPEEKKQELIAKATGQSTVELESHSDLKDIVKELEEKFFSEKTVRGLVSEDTNQYQYGRIKGQLEIFDILRAKLNPRKKVEQKKQNTRVKHESQNKNS